MLEILLGLSPASPDLTGIQKRLGHPSLFVVLKDSHSNIVWANQTTWDNFAPGQVIPRHNGFPCGRILLPETVAAVKTRDAAIISSGVPVLGRRYTASTVAMGVIDVLEDVLPYPVNGGPGVICIGKILTTPAPESTSSVIHAVPPPVMPAHAICAQCAAPYRKQRPWQRFCSPACRQIAFWTRKAKPR